MAPIAKAVSAAAAVKVRVIGSRFSTWKAELWLAYCRGRAGCKKGDLLVSLNPLQATATVSDLKIEWIRLWLKKLIRSRVESRKKYCL